MRSLRPVASFVLSLPLFAQDLVCDINPIVDPSASSGPQHACAVGPLLYFGAEAHAHGRELWRTDGTTAGTQLVADLVPGTTGSDPKSIVAFAGGIAFVAANTLYVGSGTPPFTALGPATVGLPYAHNPPVVAGARLYYVGNQAATGLELWSTDGTPAGTLRLTDLVAGAGNGDPQELISWNGIALFSAIGPGGARRVYRSDGTVAGTFEVAPAAPYGPCTRMVSAGTQVFFTANSNELWRTDGTPGGTQLLRSGFSAYEMAAVGNSVLFFAIEPTTGLEPWVSDGTTPGTQLLADIMAGAGSSIVSQTIGLFGTRAVFAARNGAQGIEPWISDLTPGGTTLLCDVNVGAAASNANGFAVAGGALWFVADDGTTGAEPWRSDGTTAGTARVADLYPGVGSFPGGFTTLGPSVFFGASDGIAGGEPWVSDGTAGGTRLLADIHHVPRDSSPFALGRLGKRALIVANDGVHGREPWITDGTTNGTSLLADLAPGDPSRSFSGHGIWKGRAWFSARTQTDTVLYATDGTTAGTTAVLTIPTPSGCLFCPIGDRAVLTALQSGSWSLWVTDGTPQGTQPLASPNLRSSLVAFAGRAWFAATDSTNGTELWRTDGTAAGTGMFIDLNPGPGGSGFLSPTPIGDRLYFGAANAQVSWPFPQAADLETWVTDGTVAGTLRLADFAPGLLSATPSQFVAFQGRVWFLVSFGTVDHALCVTDGTPAGTSMVRRLFGHCDTLAVVADRLYFQHEGELWNTKGNPGGEALVVDLDPMSHWAPADFVPLGSSHKLVFTAQRWGEPRSLWLCDGTAAGTRRISDRLPTGARPWRAGSDVFFVENDPVVGQELFALRLRSENAAMADVLSEGCAGATGVPRIRGGAGPSPGTTYTIHLDAAAPSAGAFVALAFALAPDGDRALCLTGLDPSGAAAEFTLTDPAGHSQAKIAIPLVPSVLGVEFYTQWFTVDPPGGHFGVFSLSPLLDSIVGS